MELMDHVLSTYDRAISLYTHEQFKRAGACVGLEGGTARGQLGTLASVDPVRHAA